MIIKIAMVIQIGVVAGGHLGSVSYVKRNLGVVMTVEQNTKSTQAENIVVRKKETPGQTWIKLLMYIIEKKIKGGATKTEEPVIKPRKVKTRFLKKTKKS